MMAKRWPLTGVSGQKSEEEARDMVELAVNVLNAFALSLPDAEENKSLVGRVPALIAVIPNWWVDSASRQDRRLMPL